MCTFNVNSFVWLLLCQKVFGGGEGEELGVILKQTISQKRDKNCLDASNDRIRHEQIVNVKKKKEECTFAYENGSHGIN